MPAKINEEGYAQVDFFCLLLQLDHPIQLSFTFDGNKDFLCVCVFSSTSRSIYLSSSSSFFFLSMLFLSSAMDRIGGYVHKHSRTVVAHTNVDGRTELVLTTMVQEPLLSSQQQQRRRQKDRKQARKVRGGSLAQKRAWEASLDKVSVPLCQCADLP